MTNMSNLTPEVDDDLLGMIAASLGMPTLPRRRARALVWTLLRQHGTIVCPADLAPPAERYAARAVKNHGAKDPVLVIVRGTVLVVVATVHDETQRLLAWVDPWGLSFRPEELERAAGTAASSPHHVAEGEASSVVATTERR